MKNVLAWAKSNLAVVVLSALIVLILPGAFVGSWLWNSSIRTKREIDVKRVMNELDQARVTYALPPVTPGGQPVSLPLPAPNKVVTEYFKQQQSRIRAQSSALVRSAEEFNGAHHGVLVEGVFPRPVDKLKTLEFVEALVGRANQPSAYRRLLDSIGAGGPADPRPIVEQLREMELQSQQAAAAEGRQVQRTAEEQRAHDAKMADIRLAQYRAHADRISVYATEDVLPATLPRAIPNEPPAVTTAFLWQADYWMVSDLLLAVATANARDGKLVSVMEAPVKRIESISLEPLGGARSTSGEDGMPARARSFTGRIGGGTDGLYDIRHAQVTLIVSSERLPEVLDAFSRTNFMTVVGVELASVDARAELDRGYFYGPDHVVRATLEIETVWLRSWMRPMMPDAIMAMLTGVEPDPAMAAAGGGGAGGEASAPPPRRQIKTRELPAGRRGG